MEQAFAPSVFFSFFSMPNIVPDSHRTLDGRLIEGVHRSVLVDAKVHTNTKLGSDVAQDTPVRAD